jgi:hypothetical protein
MNLLTPSGKDNFLALFAAVDVSATDAAPDGEIGGAE